MVSILQVNYPQKEGASRFPTDWTLRYGYRVVGGAVWCSTGPRCFLVVGSGSLVDPLPAASSISSVR